MAPRRSTQRKPAAHHPEVDITHAIEEMPEAYLHCRDWQHAWQAYTVRAINGGSLGYDQVFECTRCGVHRHRILDSRGHIVSARYDYNLVPGYLIKGAGRVDGDVRADIRLAAIQRYLTSHEKPATRRRGRRLKAVDESA